MITLASFPIFPPLHFTHSTGARYAAANKATTCAVRRNGSNKYRSTTISLFCHHQALPRTSSLKNGAAAAEEGEPSNCRSQRANSSTSLVSMGD